MSSVSDKEIEEANKFSEFTRELRTHALHGNVDKLCRTIFYAKKRAEL